MNRLLKLFVLFLFVICQSNHGLAVTTETTDVRISGNMGTVGKFVPLPDSFLTYEQIYSQISFAIPVTVFDSKNATYEINLFFFHVSIYDWVVIAVVDGKDVSQTEGIPVTIGRTTFTGNTAGEVPLTKMYTIANWSNAQTGNIQFTLNLTSFDTQPLLDKIEFGPGSCKEIEASVAETVNSTAAHLLSEGSLCSASPDLFGVTSGQLAERAIATNKCNTRKFKRNLTVVDVLIWHLLHFATTMIKVFSTAY